MPNAAAAGFTGDWSYFEFPDGGKKDGLQYKMWKVFNQPHSVSIRI
jgi:hypothetical protein